jgi:PAS domain S-box-containing protein
LERGKPGRRPRSGPRDVGGAKGWTPWTSRCWRAWPRACVVLYDRHFKLQFWNRAAPELIEAPSALFQRGRAILEIFAFFAERGDYGRGDPRLLAGERVSEISHATLLGPFTYFRFLPSGRTIQVRAQRTSQGSLVFRLAEMLGLQPLLEEESDAIIFIDRDQRILSFSRGAETTFGWAAKEILGKPFDLLLPEASREVQRLHIEAFESSIRRSGPLHGGGEILAVRKSGEEFPAEASIAKIRSGASVVLAAILRDASQRRQAERAQQSSEAALLQAHRLANLGHYRWSGTRHRLITCNEEYQRIVGLSAAESAGDDLGIEPYLHPDDRARVAREFRAAESEGRGMQIEFRIVRPDGEIRHIRDLSEPEPNPRGAAECWFGTIQDITDLKTTEDQLKQAVKMEAIGQLTGGIAHDFNNLLTVIIGGAEQLKDAESERNPAAKRALQDVMDSADQAARLTHGLLALARKRRLEARNVVLNDAILAMRPILERSLGEDISIATALEPALWQTRIDPHQFESALLNLAVNARDAMPKGGHLKIETTNLNLEEGRASQFRLTPGPYVCFSILDDGKGMPPETLARAIDPLFTTKPTGKGTGLGLSMVKNFATQSGGHLAIASEVGRGTTVRLYLPRAQVPAGDRPAPELAGAAIPRGNEAVLIVEDEPLVRGTAAKLLAGLGYSILQAADGRQALSFADRGVAFDLLFTDLILPGGMTGQMLAAEMHKRRPGLPVLFCSGYSENGELSPGGLEAGAVLLQKPYRRRELAEKLRTVLDEAAASARRLRSAE